MTTAYRLWEILDRSKTGPHMEEDAFLPKLFAPTLKKLIKKYEIRYDPEHPGARRRRYGRPDLAGRLGAVP